MTFGVLFVLLMAVTGWWLYSRWSDLRDAQARRREAEMMFVFEARTKRPDAGASPSTSAPMMPGDFHATLPGER
jgi:hypothetical protein